MSSMETEFCLLNIIWPSPACLPVIPMGPKLPTWLFWRDRGLLSQLGSCRDEACVHCFQKDRYFEIRNGMLNGTAEIVRLTNTSTFLVNGSYVRAMDMCTVHCTVIICCIFFMSLLHLFDKTLRILLTFYSYVCFFQNNCFFFGI